MKKSNKLSVFYVISSVSLFLVLLFGGVYGVYISVGLNFMRSSMANVAETAESVSNVAIGGTVNFQSSMTGIIILSLILIVISIFDFISLIKQIIFFKQFKVIRDSKIEESVERKVKSKGAVIVFTIIIDIISFIVGVVGIFLNNRTLIKNNVLWVLYLVDGIIIVMSLISLVLLIAKLKQNKKLANNNKNAKQHENYQNNANKPQNNENIANKNNSLDIDELEYKLVKLKTMKASKIINEDEFEILRKEILPPKKSKRKAINKSDTENF